MAAFVEGRLPQAEREALEQHIDRCADCATLIGAYGREFVVKDTLPALGIVPAELVPGARVGRYVVVRTIAAGGMGIVYRANDPEMDRPVVLKLVRPTGKERVEDEARRRLVAEARALARIAHPNVVAAYDVGTFGSEVYVAMEYVDGLSLDRWLASGEHPIGERVRVLSDAGRGLGAVHRAGFVHRDFKPSNVLVGTDGRVRLLDFGLAQLYGERAKVTATLPMYDAGPRNVSLTFAQTKTGALLGTPAYMSPEQFRGSEVDARSDQYSFCVALYEALVGRRPFDAATVEALRDAVLAGRFADPAGPRQLPRHLRQAVLRGLSVDASARFGSMDELLVALAPASSGRHWPLIAALTAAGGAGVTAVAFALGGPGRTAESVSAANGSATAPSDPTAEVTPVSSQNKATASARPTPAPESSECSMFSSAAVSECFACAVEHCCGQVRRCIGSESCYSCLREGEACPEDSDWVAFASCWLPNCGQPEEACADAPPALPDLLRCAASAHVHIPMRGKLTADRHIDAEGWGATRAEAEKDALRRCDEKVQTVLAADPSAQCQVPCRIDACDP